MSTRIKYRSQRVYDDRYAGAWEAMHLRPSAPREVIDAVYRALSRMYHPDTGNGDSRAQTQLNEAYAELKTLLEQQRGESPA